jgi:hypothetical protein
MATVAGVALVAAAIGSLALGIIGEAAFQVSTSASYARQDAVAPLVAMALRGVVAFAGMTIAFVAVDGIAVLWVLGLSCSAAMLVSAAWLHAHPAGGDWAAMWARPWRPWRRAFWSRMGWVAWTGSVPAASRWPAPRPARAASRTC